MSGETGGEAEVDMNDSKRRFFSGGTLQQALVQAANHYHLLPEEIAYHQIEKRHGFIKVRRKVVIEVDPAAPRVAGQAAPPPSAGIDVRTTAAGGGRDGARRATADCAAGGRAFHGCRRTGGACDWRAARASHRSRDPRDGWDACESPRRTRGRPSR